VNLLNWILPRTFNTCYFDLQGRKHQCKWRSWFGTATQISDKVLEMEERERTNRRTVTMMNKDDMLKVLSAVRALEFELSSAVDTYEKSEDVLKPTPFAPASDEFANAADAMKDLPFTEDDIRTSIKRVYDVIERQEQAAGVTVVALNILNKLKQIVPLLFTL